MSIWLIKAQIEAIEHLHNKDPSLKVPKVLKSSEGTSFITEVDCSGNERLIWVQTYISGKCYADIKQKTPDISFDVGVALGKMAKALADYKNDSLFEILNGICQISLDKKIFFCNKECRAA